LKLHFYLGYFYFIVRYGHLQYTWLFTVALCRGVFSMTQAGHARSTTVCKSYVEIRVVTGHRHGLCSQSTPCRQRRTGVVWPNVRLCIENDAVESLFTGLPLS